MDTNKIVTPTGQSFVFKTKEIYKELPAGVYYPYIDSNGRKHLVIRSSKEMEVPSMQGDPKDVPQQSKNGKQLTEEATGNDYFGNVNGNYIYNQHGDEYEYDDDTLVDERDFGFLDQSYFHMEKYHKGIEKIHNQINWFLKNKEFYDEHQIDYKRGILAFSNPGTGKSRYFEQQSKRLVYSKDAVVIRIEDGSHLNDFKGMMDAFVDYQHDRLKVIFIEELADLIRSDNNKNIILNLLDNQQFSNNLMFWITTNFPNKIPLNVVDRPSRIDALVDIDVDGYTDDFVNEWHKHLFGERFPKKHVGTSWYEEASKRLNVAYWKELFIFAYINDMEYDEAWKEIQARKKLIRNNFETNKTSVGF